MNEYDTVPARPGITRASAISVNDNLFQQSTLLTSGRKSHRSRCPTMSTHLLGRRRLRLLHTVTAIGESVLLSGMRSSSPLSVYIEIDLTNLAAVQPFTRRQREDDTSVVVRGLVFRIQFDSLVQVPDRSNTIAQPGISNSE